ncbi:MAG: hypothetical protein AAF629_36220, partial [Chloroflexota bacterium]
MPIYLLKIIGFIIGAILFAQLAKWGLLTVGVNVEADYQQQVGPLYNPMKAKQVEAITLGNSHSTAIDFQTLELSGHHLWRPASDLFETQYMLESWLPKLPNVKVAFIVVYYESFHLENFFFPGIEQSRRVLYSGTPTWSAINDDLNNFALGKLNRLFPIIHLARPDHGHTILTNLHQLDTPRLSALPRGTDGQILAPTYLNCSYLSTPELMHHIAVQQVETPKRLKTVFTHNPSIKADAYLVTFMLSTWPGTKESKTKTT